MEKKLTRDELLKSLIQKASDPFTTMEQKADVKKILMESTTMKGKNHLFLVSCYFNEENPLFHISEEEALRQAKLAYRENNRNSAFYLYRLYRKKDESLARNYLRLSVEWNYPLAFLEMAKLLHHGILFPEDRKKAFDYYLKAAKHNLLDGYFGMLLLASEAHDIQLEKSVYRNAIIRGFVLPGVVE